MSQLVLPWPEAPFWRKWLLRIVGVSVALYVAYVVREIWLPLGLAFLLATVLDPVVDRMERQGWKRGPAAAFIFVSFLLMVSGVLALAFPFVLDQLATVQQSLARYFPDSSPHGLAKSFDHLRISPSLVHPLVQAITGIQSGLLKSSTWLSEYGMGILGSLVWVIFVPLVGFYALRDYHLILGKALLLAPRQHRNSVQLYVAEVSSIFSRYLRGLAIVSILNGLATWGLLSVLRVPDAFLLGALAGVLYGVPYVGAFTTVLVTAAIAFVGGGVSLMIWAVGLSLVLHQLVFDQIVTPRFLGGQVGIHPIVSIVALLVGNLLLGIVGMVLAVPVAACIQIGVLALVPKLGAEFDFGHITTPSGEAEARSEETKLEHLSLEDAAETTEEVPPKTAHENIMEAVEQLEAQLKVEGN